MQANGLLPDRPARGQLAELLLGAPRLDDLPARVGLEPQLALPRLDAILLLGAEPGHRADAQDVAAHHAAKIARVDDGLEDVVRGHPEEVERHLPAHVLGDEHVHLVLLGEQAQRRRHARVAQVERHALGGQPAGARVLGLGRRGSSREQEHEGEPGQGAQHLSAGSHGHAHLLGAAGGCCTQLGKRQCPGRRARLAQ